MRTRLSLVERFWSKVDRSGGPDDCWLWMAGKFHGGYGAFGTSRSRNTRAHRFSWALTHGPIPDGLLVLHKCDTPACVNPTHLFLGTDSDNMADRDGKGRQSRGVTHGAVMLRVAARGERNASRRYPERRPRGSGHATAKLNEELVSQVKGLLRAGVSGVEIAARLGINASTVSSIKRGRTWKHVVAPALVKPEVTRLESFGVS